MVISSGAGLMGFEFNRAYAAAKFSLEGWVQSLRAEVAPFGSATIIVNPGFFCTELLTKESTTFAVSSIADYDERRTAQEAFFTGHNGHHAGNPAKLAQHC
jgi:NAD(P)-dependent dehydrogenase (short-subunit alcohol dehydrogenase family)